MGLPFHLFHLKFSSISVFFLHIHQLFMPSFPSICWVEFSSYVPMIIPEPKAINKNSSFSSSGTSNAIRFPHAPFTLLITLSISLLIKSGESAKLLTEAFVLQTTVLFRFFSFRGPHFSSHGLLLLQSSSLDISSLFSSNKNYLTRVAINEFPAGTTTFFSFLFWLLSTFIFSSLSLFSVLFMMLTMIGSVDQVRLSVIGPEGSSGASGSGSAAVTSRHMTGRQGSLEGSTQGEASNLLQLPREGHAPRPKTISSGITKKHLEVTIVSEKTAGETAEEQEEREQQKVERFRSKEKMLDGHHRKKSSDDTLAGDERHSKKDEADDSKQKSEAGEMRRSSSSSSGHHIQAQTHLHRHLHQRVHQMDIETENNGKDEKEQLRKQSVSGAKDDAAHVSGGESSAHHPDITEASSSEEQKPKRRSSHTLIEDEILYI